MRAALLLLIPLTGCLDAATGNVANVPAPTASVPREAAARRVFSTGLTAPAADRKGGTTLRSFARGRVELKLRRDSTLEYHLNVYNPAAENFTAAHIYRERPARAARWSRCSPARRSRTSTFRCAAPASSSIPSGSRCSRSSARTPAGFYVSLRTTREPQGALRGTIQ